VGKGLNHNNRARSRPQHRARRPQSWHPSVRRRGLRNSQVAGDVAGSPTPAAVCAQRPILTIVGRAFFSDSQPRLGRPRGERAEVQDTYGGDPDARKHRRLSHPATGLVSQRPPRNPTRDRLRPIQDAPEATLIRALGHGPLSPRRRPRRDGPSNSRCAPSEPPTHLRRVHASSVPCRSAAGGNSEGDRAQQPRPNACRRGARSRPVALLKARPSGVRALNAAGHIRR